MNIHFRILNYHFQIRAEEVEKVKGVASILPDKRHILMWDFDYATFTEMTTALQDIQKAYNLPDIHIGNTGRPNSWHAYCLKALPFAEAAKILLETPKKDIASVVLGISRGYWVLRFTDKKDAKIQPFIRLPSDIPPDCSFHDLKVFVEYWTRRIRRKDKPHDHNG